MDLKGLTMPPHIQRYDKNSPKVLCWRIRQCNRILRRSIEKKVAGTGVYNSQHRLLNILSHEPNISQIEISERMDISPASVAVTIKKLEKSGYLSRTVDEKDNRVNKIILTEKGNEIVKHSQIMFNEIESAMFEGFSKEEMELTTVLLEKISQNLTKYYSKL